MTLTQTSRIVRKGVVLTIVMIVTYYVTLFVVFPLARGTINSLFPDRNPPTPIYGKLPQLEFERVQLLASQSPVYKLDTKDGKLPTGIPDRMTVYKFKPTPFSYQAGKIAADAAAALGFTTEDLVTDLKGTTFTWRSLKSGGALEINKDTKEINLYTPLTGLSDKFPRGRLNSVKAVEIAKEILVATQNYNDPLYISGTQSVILGKFQGNSLVETTIPVEAQIARVDFFRKIKDYDIVTTKFNEGLIYMYVRNPERAEVYYNNPVAQTHIWEIDTQSNATYPIISINEAWNKIQQNEGVIVSVDPKDGNIFDSKKPLRVENIFIDNIYLAYYDNTKLQKYLQPIYVFEGKYTTAGTDGGAIAIYYPALTGEYVE